MLHAWRPPERSCSPRSRFALQPESLVRTSVACTSSTLAHSIEAYDRREHDAITLGLTGLTVTLTDDLRELAAIVNHPQLDTFHPSQDKWRYIRLGSPHAWQRGASHERLTETFHHPHQVYRGASKSGLTIAPVQKVLQSPLSLPPSSLLSSSQIPALAHHYPYSDTLVFA